MVLHRVGITKFVGGLALAACMAVVAAGCGEPPKTQDQGDAAPNFQPQPIDAYRTVLAQLPLRLKKEYQDFSGTDTVTGGSWMTGLHYFDRADIRELYAVFSNNHIYRVRAADLTLDWTEDVEMAPKYAPVVSDQYVFFLTEGPRVVWFYRDGQPDGYQKRYEEYIRIGPASPPAANDAGIYMGASENFRMYGYNEKAKGWDWFWPQSRMNTGRIAMQPYADADRLYFYTEDGHIHSISSGNGEHYWQWPRSGDQTCVAPFAVKYDILFVPTFDSVLYALDKSSKQLFAFQAGEPIVSTPFVQDYYIVFQTPTRMVCIKAEYVNAGENKTLLRLISERDLREGNRRPEDPLWSIPIVPDDIKNLPANQLLDHPSRKNLTVLMKGREWFYVLEAETGTGKKFLYRISATTGEFDSEIDPETNQRTYKRYDVTAFPFIVANNDENNRTLYFGTREGYIFGMFE